MTIKNRLNKLEQRKPKKPAALWQELTASAGAIVHYPKGKIREVDKPLQRVKTYGGGISPDDWD